MSFRTNGLRLVLVVAAVLGAVAVATPARATEVVDTHSPRCHAAFTSLTARDIQEENQGSDEILVKMASIKYPTSEVPRSFTQGQTRPGTDFRPDAGGFDFAAQLDVTLIEVDGIFNDRWGPATVPCPPDQLDPVVPAPTHFFEVQFQATFRSVDYRMLLAVTRFA